MMPVAAEDVQVSSIPAAAIYQAQLAAAAHEFTLADGRQISCARSYIGLHPDGRRPATVNLAAPLTDGARAWRYPRRRRVLERRPCPLGGDRPTAARRAGTLPAGSVLRWDRSGAVVGGTVKLPAVDLAGVRTTGEFELHANGPLEAGEARRARAHRGNDLPARAEVWWRADGTLERARYLKSSGFVQHQEWTDTAQIDYDRSGKVTSSRVEHTGPKARSGVSLEAHAALDAAGACRSAAVAGGEAGEGELEHRCRCPACGSAACARAERLAGERPFDQTEGAVCVDDDVLGREAIQARNRSGWVGSGMVPPW
jgi:hypothetical protein